ncbi:MAG: hypothetical protein PVJ43_11600 [Gemmatimonadales bacterium]|jgi:hypothetical protein
MGIFGDDKQQDERIAALEAHVRALTETVQANHADLAEGRIAILKLQAQLDEKVSSADVDPTIVKLNQELAAARTELEKSSAAATESWTKLQDGVRDAFQKLSTSVDEAWDTLKQA